jgi:hypothetical protein
VRSEPPQDHHSRLPSPPKRSRLGSLFNDPDNASQLKRKRDEYEEDEMAIFRRVRIKTSILLPAEESRPGSPASVSDDDSTGEGEERADRERRRQLDVLRAEGMRALDEEIRRRPAVPVPPAKFRNRVYLRPVIDQSEVIEDAAAEERRAEERNRVLRAGWGWGRMRRRL